jgi:hypothetical protein
MSDFCAFILTHGRPEKVYTYKTLRKSGYTGPIFIVIDDEDKTAKEYKKKFGDEVLVFSKAEIAKTFDEGDNFNDRRAIIYARNACFELAKQVGYKYFIQLDDDYTAFNYKFNHKKEYGDWVVKNLNAVFGLMLDYYKSIPALSIAMAQGGDFIGGKNGSFAKALKLKRKCMNSFICSTERPFKFFGRINEDVNTYTNLARRGGLFLTINNLMLSQKTTQSNSGGMTELYLDSGTYVKSFYSVMYSPSCVKISEMGASHRRLHHKVSWNNATPVIVNENFKKSRKVFRR